MWDAERVEAFRRVRKEVDPSGVLWNEWLEERIGREVGTEGRSERNRRREDVMGQPWAFLRG